MWEWLADKYDDMILATKQDYFIFADIKEKPISNCFLCDYSKKQLTNSNCVYCPVKWKDNLTCGMAGSLYEKYYDLWTELCTAYHLNWRTKEKFSRLSIYAREIANLPIKNIKEDENV